MKIKLVNDIFRNIDFGAALLRARGIEDVNTFINPDTTALQDWRDLENTEKGIELIKNLDESGNIAIIVDSDCDGYTSAAILMQYLQCLFPKLTIDYYIHRGKAHGLEEHWKEIAEKSYDLVIVPDAGSNDSKYAKEISCPILVIDHHIVDIDVEDFAPNLVVINNQLSPKYKNKDLSGAGMAYQFCRAMDFYFQKNWALEYIDLAALGVCADMMSGLEIENQYLWKNGFTNVKNYFFLSLIHKQAYSITGLAESTDEELLNALTPTAIAFYIVPLINAMIRIGSLEEKERMFIAFIDGHREIPCLKRGAKGTTEEVAIECVRECTNAKNHQNKLKETIVEKLNQKILKHGLLENQILFIRLDNDDQFPPELNGLIATQFANKYKKPTIIGRLNEEGEVKGSMRGVSNSELTSFKDFLMSTNLCHYVQGHDGAAGFSLPNSNLSKLHEIANVQLKKYNFGESYYEVNFARQASDEDLEDLIYNLSKYKFVWSQKNPEALIYIRDFIISSKDIAIMGRNKDTIRIFKNGITYLKFFAKNMIQELQQYDSVRLEIIGKANLNIWMGKKIPQIFIENYEIKKDSILDF